MNTKNTESFSTRIWFIPQDIYIKTREEFDILKIERNSEDNSQFIKIGDSITLHERKYKVIDILFKFESVDFMPYVSQVIVETEAIKSF